MDWLQLSFYEYLGIVGSAIALFFGILIFIKINGLRSFAKFSAHDFAVTIAIGSIFGSTITSPTPSILQGLVAIGTLLALQALFSKWRIKRNSEYLENEPLLIMDGSNILYDNLKRAKITENDLISKLRESNVLHTKQVQAVIFEPSGDISVLHGDTELEDIILKDVKR